jgi:2-dehydro-3-deoxygluconokinase
VNTAKRAFEAETFEVEALEVVTFGEPLVSIFSQPGLSLREDAPLSKGWGGDTLDTSIALAKLGHRTALLTRISTDAFGDSLVALLNTNGVGTAFLQRDRLHQTGLCFVSYEAAGHQFTYYRRDSAACFVEEESIDWDLLERAKVLHLSGISQGISTEALQLSFRLMEFARQRGILVSYDINYRPALWCRERCRALLSYTIEQYVDILQMTDEELVLLGWKPEAFLKKLARRPSIVALKRGARGCTLLQGDRRIDVEGFAMEVCDTVGAGDAFAAGLIAAVLRNLDLESTGRLANAVAALTCRGKGPLRGQPTMEEVEALMKEKNHGN